MDVLTLRRFGRPPPTRFSASFPATAGQMPSVKAPIAIRTALPEDCAVILLALEHHFGDILCLVLSNWGPSPQCNGMVLFLPFVHLGVLFSGVAPV